MLFLLLAQDNDDEASRQLRQDVLAEHRKTLKTMVAEKRMVLGGSLLDEDGKRTGSIAVLNMPDRAAAEAWVTNHPYTRNGVWSSYKLERFAGTQSSIEWLPAERPTV